ncbi:MAG: DUF2513 domain-containing protein [Sphingopyxis sp.]|nr:DUF2513 domain-containing protein [Sphingopyxis sp.]
MKRDMDLLRKLLLAVEESPKAALQRMPAFEGFTEDIIAEHTRLAFDAGLLEGASLKLLKGPPQFANISLTWSGHEFLEKTRDPEIWEKTKTAAGKVGSFSLPLIMEVAAGYMKAKAAALGIPIL